MKKIFRIAFILLLTACASVSPPPATRTRTLTVFAAASLTDAFNEIGKAFEAVHPGVSLQLNFAGSQTLRAQIEEGAQADIFASADAKEMEALIRSGFMDRAAPKIFLSNQLVVILPADNPADVQRLLDLARPDLKLVLAAADVPVGVYTRRSLDRMDAAFGAGFKGKVLANVVSNEDNVRQVLAKVQLGEADAGIVYTSDAVAAPELERLEIPSELNVIAEYLIAPLIASPNADLAIEFIKYVRSQDGRAVFQKWGFLPPP